MVIDESKLRAHLAEFSKKRFASALLQRTARVVAQRGENTRTREWQRAGKHALQIMPRERTRFRPAAAHEIEIARAHARKIQARANRKRRKAGIVLHAAQPLFRHRE